MTRTVRPLDDVSTASRPRRRGRVLTWLAASAGAVSGGLGLLIAGAAASGRISPDAATTAPADQREHA